jgi:hypothetical protein
MSVFGIYSLQQELVSGSHIYKNSEGTEIVVTECYRTKNRNKANKHFRIHILFYPDAKLCGELIEYIKPGKEDVPAPNLCNCPRK